MRKRWARQLAAFTGLMLVALAALFAVIQNPEPPPASGGAAPPAPAADAAGQQRREAGRQVYEAQGCARCHAVAGRGNPGFPLDGVGGRLSAEEIRMGIIPPPALKDRLPPRVFLAKQAYGALPPQDLEALVAYLQGL